MRTILVYPTVYITKPYLNWYTYKQHHRISADLLETKMGNFTRKGKTDSPINNQGQCEISSETTDTAVHNRFAVA